MSISASQVMKLRATTGLGMMTCKNALIEADGDMDKAIDNLRKQGQATAIKRAGKAAKEGKVNIVIKDSDAVIYEVNSETDFVARNEDFITFVNNLGDILLENKPADLAAAFTLTSSKFEGQSIEAKTLEIVGKIGEKISMRRFNIDTVDTSKEKVYSYIHGDGKIGVIVVVSAENGAALDSQVVADLGKDLAMQIAASKPLSITRDNVDEAIVAKEKEIFLSQVQQSGKPEKIWDKIVEGKLSKYFKQVSLLEQLFIRDTDITVADRIKQAEKDSESTLSVKSFVRYELGAED